MIKWLVSTRGQETIVEATDQFEAYKNAFGNTLPIELGLVITAQQVDATEEDSYSCRTSLLLARWGKRAAARLFIERAIELGLPDTSEEDLGA